MVKAFHRVVPLLLPLAALAFISIYVVGQLGGVRFNNLMFFAYLALGPLGMFGVVEIARLLDREHSSAWSRSAATFGTVAFAVWVVVVLVQTGTRRLWRDHVMPDLTAALPGGRDAAVAIFRGMDTIQATLDVAFDVFYCLAILCLAARMYGDPIFGRVIGLLGLLGASGLLGLNLWTFPIPPAEAGLWDLGPLTGLWWMLVIISAIRANGSPTGSASPPPRPSPSSAAGSRRGSP